MKTQPPLLPKPPEDRVGYAPAISSTTNAWHRDAAPPALHEAFPAHPYFPQLRIASDPARMLEIIRAHLKPAGGKKFHIQDCAPLRFSLGSNGSRCMLQYTMSLVDPDNGRTSDSWATAVMYAEPGRTERFWNELRAAGPSQQVPAELQTFEPLAFVPELPMILQVFPYDRLLKTLPLVLGGPSLGTQERLLGTFGQGGWRIERQSVETIRYRAEMAGVVRYTLTGKDPATAKTRTKRFYLKVYHSRSGEHFYKRFRQFCSNGSATSKEFAVVRPVEYCAERECLVLEEAPGTSLEDVFLKGGDALAAARRVARAVAAFNSSDTPAERRHPPQEHLGYLARAAYMVRWAQPESAPAVDAILNEITARLVEVPYAPVHWDLKTDHVFLDDDRVVFVDLDTLSLSDPVRDPAHLLAHIVCRIGLPTVSAELARAAGRAFVDEYFALVPAQWRRRLEVQYAAAVIECAGGVFKRQEPDWRGQLRACVGEAQRALAGAFS